MLCWTSLQVWHASFKVELGCFQIVDLHLQSLYDALWQLVLFSKNFFYSVFETRRIGKKNGQKMMTNEGKGRVKGFAASALRSYRLQTISFREKKSFYCFSSRDTVNFVLVTLFREHWTGEVSADEWVPIFPVYNWPLVLWKNILFWKKWPILAGTH